MDLVIFEHPPFAKANWGENVHPCAEASCSDLCLLTPSKPYFTCACPTGIKLIDGSSTQCLSQVLNFLIVAKGTDIRQISLDTPDYTDIIIPLDGIKHVLAVDYHVDSGYLFWTDDEAKRIRKGVFCFYTFFMHRLNSTINGDFIY